jgi:hypothetical protein
MGTVANDAEAQMVTTEQEFQNLFVTAGYGTAFGAAFGAALLSFQQKPEENLRFIYIGASVGFITGILLGSYMFFSPIFVSESNTEKTNDFLFTSPSKLTIVPTFVTSESYRLSSIQGQWNILSF